LGEREKIKGLRIKKQLLGRGIQSYHPPKKNVKGPEERRQRIRLLRSSYQWQEVVPRKSDRLQG